MPSTLTLGSKGEEVSELQRQLTQLGFGSYLDPYGVDGSFGETTRNAVEAFQKSVGITETQVGTDAEIGTVCTFLGGPVYKASTDTKPAVNRKRAKCTLTIVNKTTKYKVLHPLHLIYLKGEDKVYGWVDSANVEFAGAICGPKTWEALRKALNPDPPAPVIEKEEPPQEEPLDLSSDSGLFIMNLVTGTTITLEYKPEDVSDSVSVSFDEETPRGRSVGYTGYRGTSNRQVVLTVKMHTDLVPDGETLESMVNKFKALEYPNYTAGVVVPPNCYVNLYRGIRLSALCTQVDVNWHGDIKDNTYTHADISLTFRNTVDTPYTATIVESGGNNNNG